ncbi:hypothetical protein EV363DRAFT_1587493 [Boletus edulis]|nr:hypothetical protein EV363DRAFT_1587493 [Boletus edulis]
MANLMRTAKPPSVWTKNDLAAYHIECHSQDPPTFFGLESLPEPKVDPELLTTLDYKHATTTQIDSLLRGIDDVMKPSSDYSKVLNFTLKLFKFLYKDFPLSVSSRDPLGLCICGERRWTEVGVGIVSHSKHDRDMVLVSRLDNVKRFRQSQSPDAQAQLVAQALAAFSNNNEQRVEAGRIPLDTQIILGIMVVGTTPIFYRIPVTRDLIEHIAQGTYPPPPPPPPMPPMSPVVNRQCLDRIAYTARG